MNTRYRHQPLGDSNVFYREAGPPDAPIVLPLHGFPSSSHMFRDLIPELADRYRVIAPDLPGFGLTTAAHREACRASLSTEAIRGGQYLHGTDQSLVSPDGYTLDLAYLRLPDADAIQLDLVLDYRSNIALYPAFQAYFREHRPPCLVAWGRNAEPAST